VPVLYPKVKHLTTFICTPTYITTLQLGSDAIGGAVNKTFSEEEKRGFASDPTTLLSLRKKIQSDFNTAFKGMIRGSDLQQKSHDFNRNAMAAKLAGNPELLHKLLSEYIYGCRRATPGAGYLEALLDEKKTTVVTSPIQTLTGDSIVCEDGTRKKVDAIVCATGFDVSCRPRWPHLGRDRRNLAEEWKTKPRGYLSLCVNSYPNYFTMLGLNTPIGHGSLMAVIDWAADYILRWCEKIAREDIRTVDVTREATEDWNVYAQEFLKTTTWAGGCRSWYKNHQDGSDITALYPGSILHFHEMTETLRPVDFKIDYRSRNRFNSQETDLRHSRISKAQIWHGI
jgi:cation diffusion facilitator CzcD-associated flavoprotein CzcO